MKPVDLYPFLGVIGVKVKVWQMYGFLLEQYQNCEEILIPSAKAK